MMKKALWILILLCLTPFMGSAEEAFFTFNAPSGWKPKPAQYSGVIATYGLEKTEAVANISSRDAESETVENLRWDTLFSPMQDQIQIMRKGKTLVAQQPAIYAIYVIKDGPFKKQMDGKRDQMYVNYVFIYRQTLYSITFVDLLKDFSGHQNAFRDFMNGFQLKEKT